MGATQSSKAAAARGRDRARQIREIEERLLASEAAHGHTSGDGTLLDAGVLGPAEGSRLQHGSAGSDVSEGRMQYQKTFQDARGQNIYETLDYDRCENTLYRDRFLRMSAPTLLHLEGFSRRYAFCRWVLVAAIGIGTAIIAFIIQLVSYYLNESKKNLISRAIDHCIDTNANHLCLAVPWGYGVAANTGVIFAAAMITVYISPYAAGGGIAEVKCVLNGVERRGWYLFYTGRNNKPDAQRTPACRYGMPRAAHLITVFTKPATVRVRWRRSSGPA
jgi:hypothetical protein